MSKIGYARVSTDDQKLDLQLDALNKAGCDEVYKEHESGGKESRPELDRLLEAVAPGDTIVVWRLDRLGRSLQHLVTLVNGFRVQGVHFESLSEKIDTTSAAGELIFHVMAAFAQFERSVIRERIKAGMDARRKKGLKMGPEFKYKDNEVHKASRATRYRRAKK